MTPERYTGANGLTEPRLEHDSSNVVTLPPATIGASFAHGWETLKRHWPKLLLIGALLLVVLLVGSVSQLAWERGDQASTVGNAIGFAYNAFVFTPVELGALYALVKAVRGRAPHVDDLFLAFRNNYLSAVLAPLLTSLLTVIGLFCFILPGIYIAVRLTFVSFLVLDEGLGPLEAIQESWRRTQGRFWTLLGGTLAGLFVVWVGVFLLVVGVIPALMWAGLAYATFYASTSRDWHEAGSNDP